MNFLVSVLVLSYAVLAQTREACHSKSFNNGYGNSVCVCNVTHCDDMDPVKKTAKGVVTVIETSRNEGYRFKETQVKFGDKHTEHTTKTETITVDHSKKSQSILGFGASFTDATGYMISLLPKQLQDRFVQDFFSEKGIEFNLNRLPIGGADFSRRAYTYDDNQTDDFDLKHWSLQPEDHNYKIPFMKAAKKVCPHPMKFFGSPWSAPAWMKTNNQINHGGLLKGVPGEKYYKTFAHYFVKFLDAYKAEDLEMWGLTIENEPSAGFKSDYGFNSMGFNATMQREFIKKDLGPILEASGHGGGKPQIMIFDDQRDVIHEWAQTIFSDKNASGYVHGTAFHWYANRPDNVVNLDKTHAVDPNKFILNTEASNGGGSLGSWNNAEDYAKNIIIDLNHYVNGWCAWNMALDMKGGPNWAKLTANAPVISNPDQKEYYKNPSYYGLGHFSKFITPGSVRIVHSQTYNSDNLLSTVFQRPDGGVVVVVLNKADDVTEFNIKDTSTNQVLSHVIHAHTIQTYIYYNN